MNTALCDLDMPRLRKKHLLTYLLTSLQSDMQHERVRVSVNNAVVYIRHFLVNIRAVE